MRRSFQILIAFALAACLLLAASKKKKEEITQVHEILPDPPVAVVAETARLEFRVTPLSNKGLLSQQTRDSLKELVKTLRGGTVVKLRAFVAGTGDLRRVGNIVSEVFTDKKMPIPAISVIQIGQLPMEGAQVQIEVIIAGKKEVNPNGLGFLSGMGGTGKDPLAKLNDLTAKAIADLRTAAAFGGSEASDVLRVTCLVSSLDHHAEIRGMVTAAFPSASVAMVQAERAMNQALSECEGVFRLRKKPSAALVYLSPKEMNPSPNYSKATLVGSDRIIFTGTQMAFHYQDADIRLAFQRMAKVLDQNHGSIRRVAFSNFYPVSNGMVEKVRNLRFEFFDKEHPPAATMLVYEGLPGMDASMAIELIAVP